MLSKNFKKILVTGGGGFIGSSYIYNLLSKFKDIQVLNIDKQTYAASQSTLDMFLNFKNYIFLQSDICDASIISNTINEFKPDLIVHFAAESHVDNSIENPNTFIETNIQGTVNLLNSVSKCTDLRDDFLFHHISTDEIYGDLDFMEDPFTETSPIKPSSPYSASKASSDLMVEAWSRTFGINYLITNCSNNFGPRQHPEKLIPKTIFSLKNAERITLYGDGQNVRDWIFVEDHANILIKLQELGVRNQTFNIGGNNEISNYDLIHIIINTAKKMNIDILDDPIEYVADRLGHDRRYAINNKKLEQHLPHGYLSSFESSIESTISWYLENENWWKK
ncbi:dTDP-glucose 4,6-dehydratase [Gammaproteobacteria bacterium]|nr:dTDP-glucose 4,6-dehydratase [Gammaproteobacteria bacterium]